MKLHADHTQLRVFLGVALPTDLKEAVAHLQQPLRDTLPTIKWVNPVSMHLTLKFLGYIDADMADRLVSAIEPVGRNHAPIMVDLQGLGVFPHVRHPRVLWIGCTGDISSLQTLVSEIECALEPFGFPLEEKPYYPHLTLARIKHDNSSVGIGLTRSRLLEQPRNLGTLRIDRITLFRSDVSHFGAEYTPLWAVPLNETLS